MYDKENKLDIVEMIINNIEEDTELKVRIKAYMKIHKSTCNDYLYKSPKYKYSAIAFTNTYKILCIDLCGDIASKLAQ